MGTMGEGRKGMTKGEREEWWTEEKEEDIDRRENGGRMGENAKGEEDKEEDRTVRSAQSRAIARLGLYVPANQQSQLTVL